MDETQYHADSPPTVVILAIKPHFDALTDQQKLYAHHISRSVVAVPESHSQFFSVLCGRIVPMFSFLRR